MTTADSARQADRRFLHAILIVLIAAFLASGVVAAIAIAKSEEPARAGIVSQP